MDLIVTYPVCSNNAKEYFRKYMLDKRKIYLIGVNFDTDKGNLIGWNTCRVK